MRLFIALVTVIGIAAPALARKSDDRTYSGFKTGHCKTESCFSKHQGGSYSHPYHYGHKRPRD
jgi:hypothetical protein